MHRINMQDSVGNISASSKNSTDLDFLHRLRDKGREAASAWLKAHKADVGVRETIDINKTFLAHKSSGH